MQRAFLLSCLWTTTLIGTACATLVCTGCRPPELLNAPGENQAYNNKSTPAQTITGVGIDLAMAYGSVDFCFTIVSRRYSTNVDLSELLRSSTGMVLSSMLLRLMGHQHT